MKLTSITTCGLGEDRDVMLARQRARVIAELLGFDRHDQVRIASAVSEIARNAFVHARSGRVEFALDLSSPQRALVVRVSDRGAGIARLDAVLDGSLRPANGGGNGIVAARKLMDGFAVESTPAGTTVTLTKTLPDGGPGVGTHDVRRIAAELAVRRAADPLDELQRQNHELVATLEELKRRQTELVQLNRELEDTNRGVVALYAELDERALGLRQANELKRRFLSHMSHEFRTPLHSILALTRMLESGVDGELGAEQRKQITYVQQGASELLALVDDLLDLAKVEAGRIEVRQVVFSIHDLFGALRGMLRPLLVNERVQLVFDNEADDLVLVTDEGKVSQILRNLIANALKFTEAGEVRVTAQRVPNSSPARVRLSVTDTGIGISPADAERIFEEFAQVDGALQQRVKGTGLGLPLSRKLAVLLGGEIRVESQPRLGSTFTLELPVVYSGAASDPVAMPITKGRLPVLVVDDDPADRQAITAGWTTTPFHPVFATNLHEARALLESLRPAAVVLDVMLEGRESWPWLAEMRAGGAPSGLPVVVVSQSDFAARARELGADDFCRKPVATAWLLPRLAELCANHRGVPAPSSTDDSVDRTDSSSDLR